MFYEAFGALDKTHREGLRMEHLGPSIFDVWEVEVYLAEVKNSMVGGKWRDQRRKCFQKERREGRIVSVLLKYA